MIRRLGVLLAAAALAGCVHTQVATDGLRFDERRERLEAVGSWEARGRLAVDTGERGFQGSFRWRQNADELELLVRGPVGAGVLQVTGTPRELTVTARGDTHVLVDPEQELSELVGWWLPLGSLHAWLLGLPDPEFRASRTDVGPDGTLRTLEQRLWRVDYPSYQLASGGAAAAPSAPTAVAVTTAAGEMLVPRRIDLAHGDLRLRLTIDDWRAETPAP